ncbi:alpha-amylase family glycosyl hydrolase [Gaetbulibacter sp. M235]|uniref:alpha-amylase family glycosyl hydrolase n=1 Tax=Gaetbulibacter sp. M235 TaxID=3126510 RepID=UPI00374E7FA8
MKFIVLIIALTTVLNCQGQKKEQVNIEKQNPSFIWEGANLYFLLTDRFNNGDESNDVSFNRTREAGKLRGFEGGDIKGVTQKIEEGYFTNLGVNAIWLTPIVEQIHDATDEGTGVTYGFHGYWTRDWTALDPNYGTKEDLKQLVEVAHSKGIRIVLDAVINHTGPVTEEDSAYPEDWVRTEGQCTYQNYESTVSCTLVRNLPDIKTESNEDVGLPDFLVEKWKAEGRYEQEVAELDAFFKRTGYPRAPRFYIIKWLTDYITEFGIDGYRADTVKHTEENVWQEFRTECDYAFSEWKKNNPERVLDDNSFYLVGEVYGYNIVNKKLYDFGDKKVNYFDNSFHSLINFGFKYDARSTYESLFSRYSNILQNDMKGFGVLNYISSHDDGGPFDVKREKPYEAMTKLLLSPGTSQTYYGDETARPLIIDGAVDDANLRSFMDWESIENNQDTKDLLLHSQKLGQFRANHPAVGAGTHQMISQDPYLFYRSYSNGNYQDMVVIGLDLPIGVKTLDVSKVFKDGDVLRDAYSDQELKVENGKAKLESPFKIVLLEKAD